MFLTVLRRSLALLGATVTLAAAAADAQAYVVKRTTEGEFVHWEQRDVDYTIDPSVEANVPQAAQAVRHAMDSWSGSVGAPDLAGSDPKADSPQKPGFDEKNGIFFVKDGYAPAGRALAITVLTYDNASGKILDADIVFNGAYSFAVLSDVTTPTQKASKAGTHPSTTDGISHDEEASAAPGTVYDLHHVVAHELGHSLGMNDEMGRKDALMYRYSAPNDASMRAPATDDIEGLAQLYSTKLEGRGNGCGGATVAPKKPSAAASHAAMFATFALLAFLLFRARSDRRARIGFVLATAAATVALLPDVTKVDGGMARASELAPGQARARVLNTSTSMEDGLIRTTYALATTVCRTTSCPKLGHGVAWGGTVGNVRQEVGGEFAPRSGDEVDVTFASLPSELAPLSSPLGGTARSADADVRVITAAQ